MWECYGLACQLRYGAANTTSGESRTIKTITMALVMRLLNTPPARYTASRVKRKANTLICASKASRVQQARDVYAPTKNVAKRQVITQESGVGRTPPGGPPPPREGANQRARKRGREDPIRSRPNQMLYMPPNVDTLDGRGSPLARLTIVKHASVPARRKMPHTFNRF